MHSVHARTVSIKMVTFDFNFLLTIMNYSRNSFFITLFLSLRVCPLHLLIVGVKYPITDLNRSWGLQKVEAPRISRKSAHEGGKIVNPPHPPPLQPMTYSWYSFLLEAKSTVVRPEGMSQWKTPMTTSGIEHATFRLVAQWTNCAIAHPSL